MEVERGEGDISVIRDIRCMWSKYRSPVVMQGYRKCVVNV